jgi:DNA-binding beta-propeller fold protein YncE
MVMGLCGEVRAQKRVFATIDPNVDTEQKITFDVNSDASDNIAPNIFITEDGKRAFVSYTGSGVVLVFSPISGEILGRISTGGKPAFSTPLPGRHALAVVSVLDNKVFIIDTDTSALAATYEFADAQLGFGSIVTASPDGLTGYISSTGTGELIKFSLTDGSESGRLEGFEAPAQITVTDDGGTLLVVDTLTEELVFVDAANLTRKTTLKAKEKEAAANFTLYNKAVLAPDGATGIIASRDLNGTLGSDTVFLFKTSTGEIVSTATIGAEPGFTTLTPDGKHWAVFNEFSLTLINTSDFNDRRDLQTVRGDPLGSANVLFSPDSRFAFYASSTDDLVFVHDLATSAVRAQIPLGQQPATMAMTPDGKTIAVVDFLSNKIELLADAYLLESAKFISSPDKFTGLSLINLSDQTTTFTLTALNNF